MSNNHQHQKSSHKLRKFHMRKKWLIVGLIVVVLFLSGAVSGWIYVSMQKSTADKIASTETKRKNTINQTADKAQQLAKSGQQAQAIAYINKAIQATDDIQTKAILLLNKATTYYNNGKYDEALEAAKESESLERNDNIEKFIASIYAIKGDNQNAIKYYKKAITLVDRSQPLAESDIQDYQNIIDMLSGVKK